MTDMEIAVSRLTAWLRDYGDEKAKASDTSKAFIGDVTMVVMSAREQLRKEAEVRVYGRIIHSEISPEFGTTCGKIECPRCQEEIGIGVMDDPPPKCRCGFFWELNTEAVGTKQVPQGQC